MIRDWKDGVNSIFQLVKSYPQQAEFKCSKRGIFLQNLPKFSAVQDSNLAANTSPSPLVTTLVSISFEIILDNVPLEVKKRIDNDLLIFIKHHREDPYLLGNKLWNEEFTDQITTEL